MRLSVHFTLEELTTTEHREPSIVAAQQAPPPEVLENLAGRLVPMLEAIRSHIAGPIVVSSGYRCPALNAAIGGAKASQHMEGLAADCHVPGMTVREFYELILDLHLPVLDQAIYEYGRWVHVSAAPFDRAPRNQHLMIFAPGHYETWNANDPRVRRAA